MEAASSEMVHSSLSRYFFQGGKVIDGGIILGQLAQQFAHCDHASGVEEALVAPTLVLLATALV